MVLFEKVPGNLITLPLPWLISRRTSVFSLAEAQCVTGLPIIISGACRAERPPAGARHLADRPIGRWAGPYEEKFSSLKGSSEKGSENLSKSKGSPLSREIDLVLPTNSWSLPSFQNRL